MCCGSFPISFVPFVRTKGTKNRRSYGKSAVVSVGIWYCVSYSLYLFVVRFVKTSAEKKTFSARGAGIFTHMYAFRIPESAV